MSGPYVHLTLNHVPIIGVFFVLALLAAAWLRSSEELAGTRFVALVVLALVTIGVYFSGEAAEESIEHLARISEERIEAHEEAAVFGFTGMEILGAVALAALLWQRRLGTFRTWGRRRRAPDRRRRRDLRLDRQPRRPDPASGTARR